MDFKEIVWAGYVGPCHHGIAPSQVTDGGDGLQTWRVSANILNEQSRTADRGWPSSFGVGRDTNNPQLSKVARKEIFNTVLEMDGFFGTNQAPENGYEICNVER
jgi:hypothetical protein